MLVGLLAHLCTEGALPAAGFLAGLSSRAVRLKGLRCSCAECTCWAHAPQVRAPASLRQCLSALELG